MPEPAPPPANAAAPGLPRLSIDQLAAHTGLTVRTVRYYLQQGLLSRPEGAKRGAYYGQHHVDELLALRRWADAGHSLERIRQLRSGAVDDPPRRGVAPGTVAVWSRLTLADGLEVHVDPQRAGLAPEQLRALVQAFTTRYRQLRDTAPQETEPPH